MLDLIAVLGLATWAAGVGLALLDRLIAFPEHPTDALAMAVPLGLGVLALSDVILGEVGHLDAPGLTMVLLAGLGPALWGFRRWGRSARFPKGMFDPVNLLFDVPMLIALAGTLLTAMAPTTDGDALCYHLQVPKVFLEGRALKFEPDLHETVYPLVTEMLYAAGLAFRGPVACRLIQWMLGACLAANVMALARPILGPRARWAGAIALLVPAISNGMTAPLNDVSLAAFCNATLVAYFAWRGRPSNGSAALTGVLAGLAIGVKYPALAWAGFIGGGMLMAASRGPRPPSGEETGRAEFPHVGIFLSCLLLAGGCWYVRAYFHTGNPVYPFFRSAFGGSGIDDVLDPIKRPMPVSPLNLLTALAPMTLQPDRFDSFSHQFGPVFLLLAPAVFLLRLPGRLKEILAIGFGFLTLCLTQRQSMRFVLAALGPLSVAAAWAVSCWWDRRGLPARLLVGIVIAVLVFEAAIAAGRVRHGWAVVIGRESSESYLARREPTYRVGRWIDAHLPRSARIIGQEHRGYYLPRPYSMELAHRRRTGLATRREDGDAIAARLRDEGFTHLLLCPPEPESAVEFDPTLSRAMRDWLAIREPLYQEAITDPDGVTRRYRIFNLSAFPKVADAARARR